MLYSANDLSEMFALLVQTEASMNKNFKLILSSFSLFV